MAGLSPELQNGGLGRGLGYLVVRKIDAKGMEGSVWTRACSSLLDRSPESLLRW